MLWHLKRVLHIQVSIHWHSIPEKVGPCMAASSSITLSHIYTLLAISLGAVWGWISFPWKHRHVARRWSNQWLSDWRRTIYLPGHIRPLGSKWWQLYHDRCVSFRRPFMWWSLSKLTISVQSSCRGTHLFPAFLFFSTLFLSFLFLSVIASPPSRLFIALSIYPSVNEVRRKSEEGKKYIPVKDRSG